MKSESFFTFRNLLLELNFLYLLVLYFYTTPYMAISSLAYSFFIWGIYFRKKKKIHAALMSTGMFMDIAMVLILELSRGAMDTVFGGTLDTFPILHVACSSLSLFAYIPVIFLGYGMYFGWISRRRLTLHVYLGLLAFTLRTLGYIFMFSLLDMVQKV